MEYKVHSLLICDDVRKEETGKEILIGVYSGKIITRSPLPVTMAKLCFWIGFMANFTGDRDIHMQIISPSDKKIMEANGNVNVIQEGKSSLSVPFSPVQLPEEGVYSVRFGMGRPPRKIGVFEVKHESG